MNAAAPGFEDAEGRPSAVDSGVHRFGNPERHADNSVRHAADGRGIPNSCRPHHLDAHVVVQRADFAVDVELNVPAGSRLAVLGHNGAGKTTLLHALAGLQPLTDGHVRLGDVELERPGSIRIPSHLRRIGLLDQKPRLFPHLSALRNIAFGPRSLGRGRNASRQIAVQWLERIGLQHRASAKPHELSGGQQQRVAIARALAASPEVLLLDEPLASLDAESTPGVRRMLVDELARTATTSVLVTHDLADAWQLADECVVLSEGQVVDSGVPDELATAPRHPFTAALAGFAVVRGTRSAGGLRVGDNVLPGTQGAAIAEGADAIAIVAPASVALSATSGTWMATITEVASRGGSVRVDDAAGLAAELPLDDARALAGGRLPASGDRLWFTPDPAHVRIVPA
ncbi:sulfate/molybdate ABC transporter ATP-binding protein [Paramicrobacterium agarici]|uniref:sulfate/molybdate ABC transporter ATP-binding protein n=1 Tax=Paramicrobacterium agarici TaxID=630514 RepID=UPI001152E909|nr:ATP-binding cassette domain-containing protein [Microbacterium agarici]TQO23596.1 molybdate transport system ATP-binding protein [Microbacterium agarici]